MEDRRILLVDTAGLDPAAAQALDRAVQIQARAALDEADAILFVVDGRAGRLPEDEAVALALASERVQAHTGGAAPRKVIARLPNVVSLVV